MVPNFLTSNKVFVEHIALSLNGVFLFYGVNQYESDHLEDQLFVSLIFCNLFSLYLIYFCSEGCDRPSTNLELGLWLCFGYEMSSMSSLCQHSVLAIGAIVSFKMLS